MKDAGNGAMPHWPTERPAFATMVRLAAYTGLRAGEIVALKAQCLDLRIRMVHVSESASPNWRDTEEDEDEPAARKRTKETVEGWEGVLIGETKTYAIRAVPIPRSLVPELKALVAGRKPDELVFPGRGGKPMRWENFYRRPFKPAAERAGLSPTIRFHDLRHTYESFLAAEGAHPKSMMQRLGHSSITVTIDRYAHLFPSMEEQLTDALDERIAEFSLSIGARLAHVSEEEKDVGDSLGR